MNKKKSLQISAFIALGIVSLSAGIWFAQHEARHNQHTEPTVLQPFTFEDSNGQPRSLGEWKDTPLLINFWATWCAPCREELPLFVNEQKKHAPNNLQILAIAIDDSTSVQKFMADLPFNFPSLIAQSGGMEMMSSYGNAGALPFTLAVNRDHMIVAKKLGKVSKKDIERFVANITK